MKPSRNLMQAVLVCASVTAADAQGGPPERRMAITVDDLPAASVLSLDQAELRELTERLLAAFSRDSIPAIGFVNESKLYVAGEVDTARVGLLASWVAAGFELGNHTFSHQDLHRVSLGLYEQDITRGDRVIRRLLGEVGRTPRYFRHPFLHTGRSAAVRDSLGRFLAARGYTVAPVTVDNGDYLFAAAYDRALERGDSAAAGRIAQEYLDYMGRVVAYYDDQAVRICGRRIPQILLVHASRLNAATLPRLAAALRGVGYRFIPLDDALADPVFDSPDGYYGPSGISWLHRWALTAGFRGGFFRGEPEVPEWIARAAGP